MMGRAYESDKTRALAAANGHEPVVPPKKNRKIPWEYDKENISVAMSWSDFSDG